MKFPSLSIMGFVARGSFRLITAEQDKKDRRYVHYSLTHEGKRIAAEADDVWKRVREEMFAGISDEELEVFKRVLLKVNENIKAKSK